MTTDAARGWAIWYRRHSRRPWRLVTACADEAAARRLQLDVAAAIAVSGDWYTCPADLDPNAVPAGPPR